MGPQFLPQNAAFGMPKKAWVYAALQKETEPMSCVFDLCIRTEPTSWSFVLCFRHSLVNAGVRHSVDDACFRSSIFDSGVRSSVFNARVRSSVFHSGHAEHAQANVDVSAAVRIPALILCRVVAVNFVADPKTDAVFSNCKSEQVRRNRLLHRQLLHHLPFRAPHRVSANKIGGLMRDRMFSRAL